MHINPFYPAAAPAQLRTPSFLLRPLRAADNPLDYAAMCDRWETQAWIAGGNQFTPQTNLAALRKHEREHDAHQAFTFTILNPGQTEALGCVYITSLLPLLQKGGVDLSLHERIALQDAAVRFWLRDSRYEEFATPLLRALLPWLAQSWAFPYLLFHTNPDDTRQRNLFEAHNFRPRYVLNLTYGAFYEPPHA